MRLFKNKKMLVFLAILSIFALVAVGCGGVEEAPMEEQIEEPMEEPIEEPPVEEPMPSSDNGI